MVRCRGVGWRRAGYSVSGSPANLALEPDRAEQPVAPDRAAPPEGGRDPALKRRDRRAGGHRPDDPVGSLCEEELARKLRRTGIIPYIDPMDVRYRRFEAHPRPVAQAVMFCLMDVSGSMTEHMKDLAKRFYVLLYIFPEAAL